LVAPKTNIYEFMEYLLRTGKAEEEALTVVQDMFDQNSWKSSKPKLPVCIKIFCKYMLATSDV
jgi:hypothetical protein